jgi:lipopolysaccharide heptosyltransferase II
VKAAASGRRITLLASTTGAQAASYVPEIDEVIRYDAPWVKHPGATAPAADMRMRETLARAGFDAAVIFTVYSQSALPAAMLCHLAGIPLRLAHCRENPYRLLTDWVRDTEPHARLRHEVQRQLDLVATIGARTEDVHLRFDIPRGAHTRAAQLLAEHGCNAGDTVFLLHPGASAASRRYPPELYAEAARLICNMRPCRILVTGDNADRKLAQSVCRIAALPDRVRNVAGTLDLPELAALIFRAAALISNNTGPVHIAAAVGTPVVDLYALTNPQHTPWDVANRVLYRDVPCRYCYQSVCPQMHNHCLTLVPPAEVAAAAWSLIDDTRDQRTPDAMPPLPVEQHVIAAPCATGAQGF